MDNIPTHCKCGCGEKIPEKTIKRYKQPHYKRSFKEIGFITGHQFRGFRQRGWKGGRIVTSQGYIEIREPNHPHASQRGYVKEHRLVMEQHIKRYLEHTEVVHHINRIRDDNRLENLIILTHSDHNAIHEENRNYANKFTEQQIIEIRKIYHNQIMSQRQLAKKYNVTQGTICHIINHKSYKHIM
jgi:DNA-binding XRE family transcriptional regulator